MLDRLPVELLIKIVRLAAPLEYTPDKYKERRELLRNCCLVDKRMEEVVQPMLPEVFVVKSKEDLKLLEVKLGGGRTSGELVKLLAVQGGSRSTTPADVDFSRLSGLTPAVVDLRIFDSNFFGLSWLSTWLSQPLPTLVELTLFGPRPYSAFAAKLTPINLPHLRALHLASCDDFLSSLPRTLFAQLDVFSTKFGERLLRELSYLTVNGLDTRTVLLDATMERFAAHLLGRSSLPLSFRLHVTEGQQRILANGSAPSCDIERSLFKAVKEIRTPSKPLHLNVLILPFALHPSHVRHSRMWAALDAFLSAFQAEGVEVIWEEQPDWSNEHWTSPAFWDWSRDRRAKIEAENAGAVQ